MTQRTLYLVDASIYIFQAHFSAGVPVWSQRAEDRNAFAGFARFLLRFMQRIGHGHAQVAVAFDESLFCGFRHRLYAGYKANRVLPDDNLARQIQACAQLCEALGLQSFASREYEADDIIGTLAGKARASTASPTEVVIVTRDKDLAQVLESDADHLWDFHTETRRFRHDIHAHFGIWPEQIPCFLGLAGDASDCIPGVPGVGAVSATALLQHFGNLDALYERLEEVNGLPIRGARRCAERLREHEDIARLSRTLATLATCDEFDTPSDCSSGEAGFDLSLASANQAEFEAVIHEMGLDDRESRRLNTMFDSLPDRQRTAEVAT